jgi:hypothetical protein
MIISVNANIDAFTSINATRCDHDDDDDDDDDGDCDEDDNDDDSDGYDVEGIDGER